MENLQRRIRSQGFRRRLLSRGRRTVPALALGLVLGISVLGPSGLSAISSAAGDTPVCAPGKPMVQYSGTVDTSDSKTFMYLPFKVAEGTTRVEVGYAWSELGTPRDQFDFTTLDLALRDGGVRSWTSASEGFRGWSGSNQAKLHQNQPRIFVQADSASRSYSPGPVEPGTWNVEVGVAAGSSVGAFWRVEVECFNPPVGSPPPPDPVDPTHVARPEAGWYNGDFHVHAYHSGPKGPSYPDAVLMARAAGLDFLPITEYVVGQHWKELGPIQRANPDMVIWPGREVITYYGHAIVLNETSTLEYRHGYLDKTMARIQKQAKEEGALFSIAHPMFFPGEQWEKFCRGCFFSLGDEIDWNQVDMMEVHTGPMIIPDPSRYGLPPYPIVNPFTQPAIDEWAKRLMQGYRITAVTGSDDKGTNPREGFYGMTSTEVYASELSRPALIEAIQAGHAYVRTFGAVGIPPLGIPPSPTLEMTAVTPDGQQGMFGDTLAADAAQVTVTVKNGVGQTLEIFRNDESAPRADCDHRQQSLRLPLRCHQGRERRATRRLLAHPDQGNVPRPIRADDDREPHLPEGVLRRAFRGRSGGSPPEPPFGCQFPRGPSLTTY